LKAGDLVLVYNKALETQWGNLFKHKWNGPYRIVKQVNKGPYVVVCFPVFLEGKIKNFYFITQTIKILPIQPQKWNFWTK